MGLNQAELPGMQQDSPEQREAARLIKKSGLPPVYHDLRLADVHHGDHLKQYLAGAFLEDRAAGIGVSIVGSAKLRNKSFAAFVRGLALRHESVYYVSLSQLLWLIQGSDEREADYERAAGCEALCVTGFYDQSVDFGFTGMERRLIENFLTKRSDQRRRNYYSLPVELRNALWWSEDFREQETDRSRTITI
jgi:hypothetical protein